MSLEDSFDKRCAAYRNSGEFNEGVYAEFTELLQTIPWFAEHRRYVETNSLGFGDPSPEISGKKGS